MRHVVADQTEGSEKQRIQINSVVAREACVTAYKASKVAKKVVGGPKADRSESAGSRNERSSGSDNGLVFGHVIFQSSRFPETDGNISVLTTQTLNALIYRAEYPSRLHCDYRWSGTKICAFKVMRKGSLTSWK